MENLVSVKLLSYSKDYKHVLLTACSKPYGNNVTMKGLESIIKSGHLSVLEHCYASFDVTCSCRVLGQITRHRHLSFTVKSLRGSGATGMTIPEDVIKHYLDSGVDLSTFYKAYMDGVNTLHNEDIDYQDLAYLLPQGTMTNMVVTGNFRAWYEYLPKRLCKRAMPEHRKVAEAIHNLLAHYVPEVFDRNFLNCKNCTEKGCDF
jgi:thymidylate synthase (FAD)